ncbi:MAG: glycosyltransferase [Clostridiales bacterium]|nr:glycosyltransferase [Clostridiales bacterium]
MKILLLHDVKPEKQNGVSISLAILLRELEKTGHDVRVLTLSDDAKSCKEGNVYALASMPAFIYPGIRLRTKKHSKYVRELVKWGPDVIHTNCEFSTFEIAKYIYKKCEKKPVWIHTLHTDYRYYVGPFVKNRFVTEKFIPWYLNRCFLRSDALIVPTSKTYDYVKTGKFSDKINTVIIPTGIDFSELGAERRSEIPQTRKELGIPGDAKVVIFLGRVSSEKNLDELAEFFAEYVKTHDNTYFLSVGDGPSKETLKKKIKKLGIENKAVIHDGVPHSEIRKYYDAADVFASASMSETQGLTFYEALYCNLPVIAKDRRCLEDAITEGQNGAFFDDEESFIRALDSVIDVKNGKENSKQLPECFESEKFASSVLKLYEEELKKKNG